MDEQKRNPAVDVMFRCVIMIQASKMTEKDTPLGNFCKGLVAGVTLVTPRNKLRAYKGLMQTLINSVDMSDAIWKDAEEIILDKFSAVQDSVDSCFKGLDFSQTTSKKQ